MYNQKSFRSNKMNDKNAIGNKKENKLTPQEIKEKRTKLTIGCCVAVAVVINLLYFTMKKNIKYGKINLEKKRFEKIPEKYKILPKDTFDLFSEHPENYPADAAERFSRYTGFVKEKK